MSETTTFRAVMAEILTRITAGPWGPGTLLPNEVELAESFGCSRTTMNRALRELADMGLLDRKRKSGTRVRMTPLRAATFQMPMVRSEIEKSGEVYTYQCIAQDAGTAPDWLAQRMGLAPGTQVLHLVCLHFANARAFQLEDRWINLAALPDAKSQDFAAISPSEWLIAAVPYSQVEVSFLAIAADAVIARHLDQNPGEPVLCLERATWWQNAAITLVRLCHPRGYRMTTRY